jgi:hypothetical protein
MMPECGRERVCAVTPAQMRALQQMADDDWRYTFGLNSTNMTGCALQRMGLAKFKFDNVMVSGVGRWHITDEGRALLASVDTHPKDGDVKQAPLVSGAVAKPDAQTVSEGPLSNEEKA